MANLENHQRAAMHLEEAANYHHEAAKYFEEGNHSKAYHCTLKAFGHCMLAAEAQKENIKGYEQMLYI